MLDAEVRERVARVESLLEAIEDDEAATEAVAAVVELYGEGLRRIVESGGLPPEAREDELVSHLLLLHELHPEDVESRVRRALDGVRPYLHSHGGDVELLAVEEDVVRVRLDGSCDGCPSSAATLRLAIEDAVAKAAPEVAAVEAEGVAEPAAPGLLQIGSFVRDDAPAAGTDWTVVGSLPQLRQDGLLAKEVAGEAIAFVRAGAELYAYRDRCPGCGGPMAGGSLGPDALDCPGCGRRYDIRRAGRCLDEPQLYLDPIPLLVGESGLVKIAVPEAAVP